MDIKNPQQEYDPNGNTITPMYYKNLYEKQLKINEAEHRRRVALEKLLEDEKILAAYNQLRYEAGDELISEIDNVYPEITNWPLYKELQKIIQEGPPK
ncbi:MAG TPA: hypothetical protein DCO75_07575 [Fibrobacteres bacterium]|jgi:hypothetical protein|nr:hypothetical protein [Fibrobacterota bacterium]